MLWIAWLYSDYFVAWIALNSALSAHNPHTIIENILVFSLQLVLCIYFLITREHRILPLCSHQLLRFIVRCMHIVFYVCGFMHFFSVHSYYCCLENVWSLRPYIWDNYPPRMEICSSATDLNKSMCVELFVTFHHLLTIIL